MIRRIPLNSVTKAMYERLNNCQTTPVYGDVPPEAQLPYITFGNFTCKPTGTKINDVSDISFNIDIWSKYSGIKEVNEIADEVISVVMAALFDLSEDNYEHLQSEVDFMESYPEDDNGYHGVITFLFKVRNKLTT